MRYMKLRHLDNIGVGSGSSVHPSARKRSRVDRIGRLGSFKTILGGILLALVGTSGVGCQAVIGDQRPVLKAVLMDRESNPSHGLVSRLRRRVEGPLLSRLGEQPAAVLSVFSQASEYPAGEKLSLAVETLLNPWDGFERLDRQIHRVIGGVEGNRLSLAEVLEILEGEMGYRPKSRVVRSPPPHGASVDEHLQFAESVLEQAARLREQALAPLSSEEREFLFQYPSQLVEDFSPQLSGNDPHQVRQAKEQRRFVRLIAEKMEYPLLVASAQILTHLVDEAWLEDIHARLVRLRTPPRSVRGVEGEVVLVRHTRAGRIVIGGAGENRYHVSSDIALIIDVGGNDTYTGHIAASSAFGSGNSVVIDLAGDDSYDGDALGFATGRLGIGLLVDVEGDDTYHLSYGTGGAGFAGLGMLVDFRGHDFYRGSKLTQGAAIGGFGLLLDAGGHDEYASQGYSMGFGGPSGLGIVVDTMGDDSYHCGDFFESRYNTQDVPSGNPTDPLFQYDGFCMGVGSGTRIYPKKSGERGEALAGGWGILLDLDGNDRYASANFSQGVGYFFGVGLKVDVAGQDHHVAARYGHGAAAHFGVGFFLDEQGSDWYGSTGPMYNGGVAWDRSVAFCIDGGSGGDRYEFSRSDGLGRADHGAWSLFIDEGGSDHYVVPRGFGLASSESVSGFVDLHGDDEYVSASGDGWFGNQVDFVREPGGIFMDW